MNKSIITAVGKDSKGIVARISTYLCDHNASILDISQTIVQGYFNMMMIVNTDGIDTDYSDFSSGLQAVAEELGIELRCQRSDIFDKMHRI